MEKCMMDCVFNSDGFCLVQKEQVGKIEEFNCVDYRDFPIYDWENVKLWNEKRITKEQILEFQAKKEKVKTSSIIIEETQSEIAVEPTIDLNKLKVVELKEICKEKEIKLSSKAKKAEIIEAILASGHFC